VSAFPFGDFCVQKLERNNMRVWSHELDRNGDEVVMAYVKVLSQHLHGGIEDKIKTFSKDSWCPGQGSNRMSPEHTKEVLLFHSAFLR
jgi:hypothetical protein